MTKETFKLDTFSLILIVILSGILLSQFLNRFVFFKANVEGSSMYPTLEDGDTVLVWRLALLSKNAIIVAEEPDATKLVVKRLVALPGDYIQLKDGLVYVNDKPIRDVWSMGITESKELEEGIRLKGNEYYVLGDNRENSKDSRMFGVLKRSDILGVVLFY